MTKFERCALALLGASVTALIVIAVYLPADGMTAVPRAGFKYAVSASIPPRPASEPRLERIPLPDVLPSATPTTVHTVSKVFAEAGYDLASVIAGREEVPRVLLTELPDDLKDLREVKERKALFFKSVLPLVLQVNEEILADRRHLWKVRVARAEGRRLDALDRLWIAVVSDKYRVRRGDLDALSKRIDIIPPSLALAQAAAESGWGTSRFVREGNAIFGQWTFSRAAGLEPRRRDEGKHHLVRAFDSLLDSARAYALNLNTHRAYREFRAKRAELRHEGTTLDGEDLANTLTRYSEQGSDYIDTLHTIMAANDLDSLDGARLRNTDTQMAIDGDTGLRVAGEAPALPADGTQPAGTDAPDKAI